MSRRRRRRTSIVEDTFEIASSGPIGASVVLAMGIVVPFLFDYLAPRPTGNQVTDVFALAVRDSWVPGVYYAGLVVALIASLFVIGHLVKGFFEGR